jgi:hypothetical protein
MRPVLIVDCETTSLTPDYATGAGVIWELAVIEHAENRERLWRMKPDLVAADAAALSVGRYYERTAGMCSTCTPDRAHDLARPELTLRDPEWSEPPALAAEVAPLLDGATIIAANPAFDAGFLAAFLARYGQAATWHYRLRDIGSMAAGYLARGYDPEHAGQEASPQIPALDASTDEHALALGIDPTGFDRHTALGDCRLVQAMLDVIGGGRL